MSDEIRMTRMASDDAEEALLFQFIYDSNAIEGIYGVKPREIEAHEAFLKLDRITISDLERFVAAVEPEAKLRSASGMNVRVGYHVPIGGGAAVVKRLEFILAEINNGSKPFVIHKAYEHLHPFTDGNGRSGRVLWLWQMVKPWGVFPRLGFLHSWYYQSLESKP